MHDVFFFTDIHGQYHLYDAIINDCFALDPECTVVFGGDACDRGPDGYKIMRELLDNPRVVYLKGNHEAMFVLAARELLKNKDQFTTDEASMQAFLLQTLDKYFPAIHLHILNDGARTLIDWVMHGMDEEFVNTIDNLPLTFSYENIDFCHAGSTYNDFKVVADAEYEHRFIWQKDKDAMLWDRKNLALGWATGRICVFGHTPATLLPTGIYGRDQSMLHVHPCAWQDKMHAIDKRGGWKIDMDTGAVWSNRAYVLNCLTMKVVGYEDCRDTEGNSVIKIIDRYKII